MTPPAPDPPSGRWVRVCHRSNLEESRPFGTEVDEIQPDPRVCVVLHQGHPLAMLDRCPHRDLRVSGGLVRDGLLTCPGHFWRFALSDGRRTDLPTEQLNLYQTRTDEQGWVWALIPPPPEPVSIRQWLLDQAHTGQDDGPDLNRGSL